MGNPAINEQSPVHFFDGAPVDFYVSLHYGNAGITTWQDSPVEPIAALLTDLGPIAAADYNASLQGGTLGDHLHTSISTRPGPFFDYYRGIIDPLVRTTAQTAELKASFVRCLLRALAQAVAV